MTGRRKRRAKALIIRYELPFYAATAAIYFVAVPLTLVLFPDVSNAWLSVLILVSGFTASLGSMASAVKADDTTT